MFIWWPQVAWIHFWSRKLLHATLRPPFPTNFVPPFRQSPPIRIDPHLRRGLSPAMQKNARFIPSALWRACWNCNMERRGSRKTMPESKSRSTSSFQNCNGDMAQRNLLCLSAFDFMLVWNLALQHVYDNSWNNPLFIFHHLHLPYPFSWWKCDFYQKCLSLAKQE